RRNHLARPVPSCVPPRSHRGTSFSLNSTDLPVHSGHPYRITSAASGRKSYALTFPSTYRRHSSPRSTQLSIAVSLPDLPTGNTAGASCEATGDSLHLALVLRESRFSELAITLTGWTQRNRPLEHSMDDLTYS